MQIKPATLFAGTKFSGTILCR